MLCSPVLKLLVERVIKSSKKYLATKGNATLKNNNVIWEQTENVNDKNAENVSS